MFESYAPLSQAGAFGFVVGAMAKPAFQTLTNASFKKMDLKPVDLKPVDLEPVDLAMHPVVIKEVTLEEKSNLEEVKKETRIMRYLMLLRQRNPFLRDHLPGYYGCFTGLSSSSLPVAYLVMDRIVGASLAKTDASPFDVTRVSPFDASKGWAKAKAKAKATNYNPTTPPGHVYTSPLFSPTSPSPSKRLALFSPTPPSPPKPPKQLGKPIFQKPVEVFDLLSTYLENPTDTHFLKTLCTQVLVPLAKVLHELHTHNVAHGDVKPSNMMYGHTGADSPVGVYLVDFGHTCLNPALVSALNLTSYPTCAGHPLEPASIWHGGYSTIDIGMRYKTFAGQKLSFDDFVRDDWWGFYVTVHSLFSPMDYPDHEAMFKHGQARGDNPHDTIKAYREECLDIFLNDLAKAGVAKDSLCPRVLALAKAIGTSKPLAEIGALAKRL